MLEQYTVFCLLELARHMPQPSVQERKWDHLGRDLYNHALQ
jgi:hypothetical protein